MPNNRAIETVVQRDVGDKTNKAELESVFCPKCLLMSMIYVNPGTGSSTIMLSRKSLQYVR